MSRIATALITMVALVMLCTAAMAASLDAAKTEEKYGFQIKSDKPVVDFEEGDSVTIVVTDPEKLSKTLGISDTKKGDKLTMTYEGGNKFAFSGNSQGRASGLRIAVATIGL
jgi:hypothetical protein